MFFGLYQRQETVALKSRGSGLTKPCGLIMTHPQMTVILNLALHFSVSYKMGAIIASTS